MPIKNELLNILTGKKELPIIKVEPTPETATLIRSSVMILAGAITLLALANMSKRK